MIPSCVKCKKSEAAYCVDCFQVLTQRIEEEKKRADSNFMSCERVKGKYSKAVKRIEELQKKCIRQRNMALEARKSSRAYLSRLKATTAVIRDAVYNIKKSKLLNPKLQWPQDWAEEIDDVFKVVAALDKGE